MFSYSTFSSLPLQLVSLTYLLSCMSFYSRKLDVDTLREVISISNLNQDLNAIDWMTEMFNNNKKKINNVVYVSWLLSKYKKGSQFLNTSQKINFNIFPSWVSADLLVFTGITSHNSESSTVLLLFICLLFYSVFWFWFGVVCFCLFFLPMSFWLFILSIFSVSHSSSSFAQNIFYLLDSFWFYHFDSFKMFFLVHLLN